MLDRIALILSIIGGINWGLYGLFRFDLVAAIAGSSDTLPARIIYVIIGASAIWCLSLLFRENKVLEKSMEH